MDLIQIKKNNIVIEYDPEYDMITAYKYRGPNTLDEEVEPGLFLNKDEKSQQVYGFTMFDFMIPGKCTKLPFGLDCVSLKSLLKRHIH